MGRPSKYDGYVAPLLGEVERWAKVCTDERIAEKLGISPTTLIAYKKRYPEFSEAIKRGRQDSCDEVLAGLLKRALGYEYEEAETRIELDGKKVITKRTRHMPPDVAAANLWLKNYMPGWANDPQALAVRQAELELKRRLAESERWGELVALV